MKFDITQLIPISGDKEFKEAIKITENLIKNKKLKVLISSPHPGGVSFSFDGKRVESEIERSTLSESTYERIFENELAEMILANLTDSLEGWLHYKIVHEFEDELRNVDEDAKQATEKNLRDRYIDVGNKLINASWKQTFLLRRTSKNQFLSSIDWEINHKVFDADTKELQLPPFATLMFEFDLSHFTNVTRGKRSKTTESINIDMNLDDLDDLIERLSEIKLKLQDFVLKTKTNGNE